MWLSPACHTLWRFCSCPMGGQASLVQEANPTSPQGPLHFTGALEPDPRDQATGIQFPPVLHSQDLLRDREMSLHQGKRRFGAKDRFKFSTANRYKVRQ